MSDLTLTLILFGALLIGILLGLPVAFVMGGIGAIFLFFTGGVNMLAAVPLKVWYGMTRFVLVACPLFIFMGLVLERSGIAEALYGTIYKWFGPLKGGLGMGTIVICAIFAACTGITGAATVTMAYIALPSMMGRGYKKSLAIGTVAGGGLLGILIPPSLDFILIGIFGKTSIGGLYGAGLLSGLVLAAVYMLYIGIRAFLQEDLAPALPIEERVSWREKFASLRGVILPIVLVVTVLGSIITGMATPTEAAGIGATGSLICAAINRKFTWQMFKEATIRSFRINVMLLWMIFGAYVFTSAVTMAGAGPLIGETLSALPGGRWVTLIAIMLMFFILGFIMPIGGIIMVTAPIFFPLMASLGFSKLWFGVLMVMNVEISFITPPFGFNLFYLKAVTPEIDPSITTGDIYRAVIPFVGCVIVAMVIIMLVPGIATWLPRTLMGIVQ